MVQKFVEWRNGREQWIFPGEKYKAAVVWEEIRSKKGKKEWQRLVWTSLVVPKHAVIAWMAILNKLPTKDRLMSWEMVMDGLCCFCKQKQDSVALIQKPYES